MEMKSILTALFVSTMGVPAIAGAAHDICLQASDYEGCMRVQQNGGVASSGNDELANLRNAMKQVAARLSAGTSLRDSSEVFRPVTDAIAVVLVLIIRRANSGVTPFLCIIDKYVVQ